MWNEKTGASMSGPTMSRAIKKLGWKRESGYWVKVE